MYYHIHCQIEWWIEDAAMKNKKVPSFVITFTAVWGVWSLWSVLWWILTSRGRRIPARTEQSWKIFSKMRRGLKREHTDFVTCEKMTFFFFFFGNLLENSMELVSPSPRHFLWWCKGKPGFLKSFNWKQISFLVSLQDLQIHAFPHFHCKP